MPAGSFNPCFLGTRPRTPIASTGRSEPFWCFNPCFLGTRPRTSDQSLERSRWKLSFNPCFLGTRPRTPPCPCRPRNLWEFQSLFSWNSPSDLWLVYTYVIRPSFNPCFLGTRPRTPGRHTKTLAYVVVSILVFLELALGLKNQA